MCGHIPTTNDAGMNTIFACSRASGQCDLKDVTTLSGIMGKDASASSRAFAVSYWTCNLVVSCRPLLPVQRDSSCRLRYQLGTLYDSYICCPWEESNTALTVTISVRVSECKLSDYGLSHETARLRVDTKGMRADCLSFYIARTLPSNEKPGHVVDIYRSVAVAFRF
jgi:hypothetical protein